ncbi:hypothetical protein GCM10027262_68900 [Nocardia tengchongensis]
MSVLGRVREAGIADATRSSAPAPAPAPAPALALAAAPDPAAMAVAITAVGRPRPCRHAEFVLDKGGLGLGCGKSGAAAQMQGSVCTPKMGLPYRYAG